MCNSDENICKKHQEEVSVSSSIHCTIRQDFCTFSFYFFIFYFKSKFQEFYYFFISYLLFFYRYHYESGVSAFGFRNRHVCIFLIRVLLFYFFLLSCTIGGAERLIVNFASVLKEAGHDIVIVTSHHDNNHCFDETKINGI